MNRIDIRMQADRKAEVLIYGVIGDSMFSDGISARTFAEDLKAMGDLDEINVRINSPGGAISDGLAIYNTLASHPARVIVDVDGLAASAASFVMMAADEIRMAENAMLMIHNAQGRTMGDHNEHMKTAETLEKMTNVIATTYAKRTGRKPETFIKLMNAETWFNSTEAKDAKLVDKITPAKRMAACFDLSKLGYSNVPESLLNALDGASVTVAAPESETIPVAATDATEPVAQESKANPVAVRLKLMELESE